MQTDPFSNLPAPTWPRLRALLDHLPRGGDALINMTIGEPKHKFPGWVADALHAAQAGYNSYPDNNGIPALRGAIADWVQRRYDVALDPDSQVLNLNGTREGLYNAMMALPHKPDPVVLVPNPFYQVYMIAALSVAATPVYLNAMRETGYLPDLDAISEEVLNRTTALYLCSPSNPQGAVADLDYWCRAIELAEKYDFRIFADECYAEIYCGTPPPGAVEAVQKMGADPNRVLVFHSLSKRSNLPGLRSGFVASGPDTIARLKTLRAYSGAPVPGPIQEVSAMVWADDGHVVANRQLYCDKFKAADHIFAGIEGYQTPKAGFFLWLPVDDGEAAAVKLWQKTGVRVLPGSYLAQDTDEQNPGKNYIRVALVAPIKETQRGLMQIRSCIYD